jgi:hypothetical protein
MDEGEEGREEGRKGKGAGLASGRSGAEIDAAETKSTSVHCMRQLKQMGRV